MSDNFAHQNDTFAATKFWQHSGVGHFHIKKFKSYKRKMLFKILKQKEDFYLVCHSLISVGTPHKM
jgi:hypothetical protein